MMNRSRIVNLHQLEHVNSVSWSKQESDTSLHTLSKSAMRENSAQHTEGEEFWNYFCTASDASAPSLLF